jgi:hypothetical protein
MLQFRVVRFPKREAQLEGNKQGARRMNHISDLADSTPE